ncbi:cold shock domain protein CspD [Mesorhizobium japonicum]|nr:cold shock domain protein CspD [Mesorhizobium japonicum]OBQ95782.1 cold shock domain protein CspD [Mesorhizobium sp. AA23]
MESEGTVKWYNSQKRFGFIAPEHGEKDIFVHATALSSMPTEGQKVFVQYAQGKKGPEVRSVPLA